MNKIFIKDIVFALAGIFVVAAVEAFMSQQDRETSDS